MLVSLTTSPMFAAEVRLGDRKFTVPDGFAVERVTTTNLIQRPVSATADSHEVRDVTEVLVRESRDRSVTLLFDPEHNLEERILIEQFAS